MRILHLHASLPIVCVCIYNKWQKLERSGQLFWRAIAKRKRKNNTIDGYIAASRVVNLRDLSSI